MSEKFLNETGLSYYHNRAKTLFGNKIEKILIDGVEQTITNKEVDLDLYNYAKGNIFADQTGDLVITEYTSGSDHCVEFEVTDYGIKYGYTGGDIELVDKDYVSQNGGKIDKIKVNGTEQIITNKEVDITVPTKTSDLTNDSDFIDNTVNNLINYYKKTETYSQSEVDDLISAIESGRFVKVDELPTASASTMHKIYLVPRQTQESGNICDEYITIENDEGGTKIYSWEIIGSTAVDLDGYWNEENLVAITTAEIDEIIA